MDFKTGKQLWKNRSVGKGSVTYADKQLYALGEDGMVGLIEAIAGCVQRGFAIRVSKRIAALVVASGNLRRYGCTCGIRTI